MKNLYVKDDSGNYLPIRLEMASVSDLANKLILITVGSDNYDVSADGMEHIRESFIKSEIIIDAMRRSEAADILIIPHKIRFELLSKGELESKTVCIRVDKDDEVDDLSEIRAQIKKKIGKDAVILPSPISVKEYKEIKEIKERIQIRKSRHGGGPVS